MNPPTPDNLDELREKAESTLDAFWHLARAACAAIERARPDVVIVLYHSGQGVLRATTAAWAKRYTQPFPPVVRINWGSEKTRAYRHLCHRLGRGDFVAFLETYDSIGHFLAWIADQPGWQEALAARVRAAQGHDAPPGRVLILDEVFYEGTASLSALGLVELVYPDVHAESLTGSLDDWKGPLARHWLAEHHPEVYERIEADMQARRRRYEERTEGLTYHQIQALRDRGDPDVTAYENTFDRLADLVTGTEDVHTTSLDWRPIARDNPKLQRLAAYLPVETLLALSETIYARIEDYVRARAADDAAWNAPLPPGLTPGGLPVDLKVLRETWRRGRLARRDVVALTGLSPYHATRLLKTWTERGFLVRRGRGGGTFYELRHRHGILAYGALLSNPGNEIAAATVRQVPVTTPFPVEYARADPARAGAPTLIPVPERVGVPVPARVLLIRPDIGWSLVSQMLYRWAVNRVGEVNTYYDEDPEQARDDDIIIKWAEELGGVPTVHYVAPPANIPEIMLNDASPAAKAAVLAALAVASVTPETYAAGRDGVHYLAQAIDWGIRTPLTDLYRAAILRAAGGAPDLATARHTIARHKGIPRHQPATDNH